MLKRLSCIALFLCAVLLFGAEAKYVFLMIGDGFGENSRQLLLTQYPDSVLGKLGDPIPTGTLNAEGKITDSAASGSRKEKANITHNIFLKSIDQLLLKSRITQKSKRPFPVPEESGIPRNGRKQEL